jgi:carbonic anhydrase
MISNTLLVVLGVAGLAALAASQPTSAPYLSIYDLYGDPAIWPGLCQTGKAQSPIDIDVPKEMTIPAAGTLLANWSTAAVINVSNPDHDTMQINFPAGSTTHISFTNATSKIEKTLNLVQLHWHHGSEHSFNGSHADVEAHFVHSDPLTGHSAVLALLLWNGSANDPALQLGLQYRPTTYKLVEGERVWNTNQVPQSVNLQALFAPYLSGPFAYYVGSLTTPPCTENVEWLVFTDYFEVGAEQLAEFDAYVQEGNGPTGNDDNERPDQPLNDRIVEFL